MHGPMKIKFSKLWLSFKLAFYLGVTVVITCPWHQKSSYATA